MKYEYIDGKPVPAKLYHELAMVKATTGAVLTSCLRTQDAVNAARAKGYTLSSQAELYDGFRRGLPGYNPANPPGRSTHELRNDGVAYPGPVGMLLRYWQVGQDWGSGYYAQRVVAAARARGWQATITYPSNPREQHHVNFRKEPFLRVFIPLKKGSKGRRVRKLRRALGYVRSPKTGKPYLADPGKHTYFGAKTHDAVVRYQREHGQAPDGVYGQATHRQMKVSIRHAKKNRSAEARRAVERARRK